jgi:hypothetical protein|tara:strand:- start:29 stop:244 length:216 start_codon:yes stop_codon:yes gene_type:complete
MAYSYGTSGYLSNATSTGTYSYTDSISGFSADAVTIASDVIDYLYIREGYSGSVIISITGGGLVLFLQLHD